MLKSAFAGFAALCGIAICQAAGAQSPAGAATAEAAGEQINEIVVTAQRRSENLQQVPISVTAFSGENLAATVVQDTSDLTLVVPGLLYGRSTNFNQPSIRGIGTRNAASGDEPNVATYIDGVYQPDSVGSPYELSNVQDIEVLKGPQGTLYGRNATGGAILISTRAPTFEWHGAASADYGSFGYEKFAGYISGPIIGDKVAASLSAVQYGDNGYVHNIYLNDTTAEDRGTALRVKLLYEATRDLSFQLNGFYSRSLSNVLDDGYLLGGNSQVRQYAGTNPFNPNGLPSSVLVTDRPYTTANAFNPENHAYQQFIDGHFNWDLGWSSLSGYTSVGKTRETASSLTDASPLALSRIQYESINKNYNQELVLTSTASGRLTWMAGITAFQANDTFPLVATPKIQVSPTTVIPFPVNILYGQSTRSAAAFGETTWEAVDSLFLTAGLRYSWDRKAAFNQTLTAPEVSAASSFYNLSPRAVVRYEFTRDTNVYASYTEGYKSGGFNATSASAVVTATGGSAAVRPETVDAFEVGVKSKISDSLLVDLAAFHYKYKDLQVSAAETNPVTGASLTNLQNAGAATINGLEANAVAQLVKGLSVNASASWLHADIDNFPNASIPIPITNLASCVPGGVPTLTGNVSCTVNVSGKEMIRAPRYTFGLGASYETNLAGGDLALSVNAFFSDKYYVDLANTEAQPSYKVVNASVTWRAPDHHTHIGVYGKNLTDQIYMVGALVSDFGTTTQAAKPRTFGGTIGYDF
jgi:iron complex outermembrane recepter protein